MYCAIRTSFRSKWICVYTGIIIIADKYKILPALVAQEIENVVMGTRSPEFQDSVVAWF